MGAFLLGSGKQRVNSSLPLQPSPCSDFVLHCSLTWTSVTTSYSCCLFFLVRLYHHHNLDQVPNFCYWNNAAVKQWTFPVPLNHTQFCSQRNPLRCRSDCVTETWYLPCPFMRKPSSLTLLKAFPNSPHTHITVSFHPQTLLFFEQVFFSFWVFWGLLPLTLHPSIAGLPSSPFCLADSNSYLMSCLRCPCIWEALSGLDFSSSCASSLDRFERVPLSGSRVPP